MAARRRPYPRKKKLQVQLEHDVEVEIEARPARFEPSPTLRYLDLDRIARRARVRIEIGRLGGDGCEQAVHATVRKGLVTGIEIDACCGCEEKGSPSRDLPPALRRAVDRAVRELAPPPPPAASKLPIPLGELVLGDISTDTWGRTCWRICFDFLWMRVCQTCCTAWGPHGLPPTTMCWPVETKS